MRQTFVPAKTRKEAQEQCPWAEIIIKVCGGYMCYESIVDYDFWCNQQ